MTGPLEITYAQIDYFISRLRREQYFSLAGYSDAEWYCILGKRVGSTTGLGQIISAEHGQKLLDVIYRRCQDRRFLFTIPACLNKLPEFENGDILKFLAERNLYLKVYERDAITDELAERAGLHPLIKQLQKMSVVIIGNRHLRKIDFLNCKHFIETSYPNLHLEKNGIDRVVSQAIDYCKPAVYLVSAGVSAAVIIDRLHDEISDSFFMDCGSIWDAFVGVGAQRQWRADLYSNPRKWERWKRKNIYGTA